MKKIYSLFGILISSFFLLNSCGDMEEVYKEFKGDGPIVYVAKVKDVVVAPGFNKAEISWAPLEDPRIKSVTVTWSNGKGTQTFDWDPTTPFKQVITDLPEGSIIFNITNKDSHGNKSVSVDVAATIYGNNFISLLDRSSVVSGTYNETTNEVSAALKHSTSVYYVGTEFVYKGDDGETKKVVVPKGESLSIDDVSDLNIQYHSIFAPEAGALENYETELVTWEEIKTPIFNIDVDKVLLAAASGCVATLKLTANRAPITVSADVDWVTCSEVSGTVAVQTVAKNETGVARTCTVSIKAKDGKADVAVKQTPDRIGEPFGTEGVIWWQNSAEPTQYKIISAARGNCKWSTATVSTGATAENGQSFKNGALMNNNDILKEVGNAETYPAVYWCASLGEGWYLPSGTELKALIEAYNGNCYTYAQLNGKKVSALNAQANAAREKFDNSFVSIGAPKLNTAAKNANGDWLWSSQEVNTTNAYAARMGVSGYGSRSKKFDGNEASGPFYTRAMKVVTIED